jgi:hypothetical protein
VRDWHVEYDPTFCAVGSGWKIRFYNASKLDPFPPEGAEVDIAYLAQEGNSDRCIEQRD